jgi:hypothetical protein
MAGQESGEGDRLERSVGDGANELELVYEVLLVDVTLHAELVLLDELVWEAIDGQGNAQGKRGLSHFTDSLALVR